MTTKIRSITMNLERDPIVGIGYQRWSRPIRRVTVEFITDDPAWVYRLIAFIKGESDVMPDRDGGPPPKPLPEPTKALTEGVLDGEIEE